MAVTALNTIKNWFKTGLKPTQNQFWDTWDSFFHKGEVIPVASIEGIDELLQSKASSTHLIDVNAHTALFGAKEDKNQKGVAGGYAPLNDFLKLESQFLEIIDDLVTGGATSLLSAEQGKILQTQINAINTLLTSDDINLDTIQEIVDAIKEFETSLSTILVNDLTTGGTTKALTAEMGKTLKGLIDSLTTTVSTKQDIANQIEVGTSQNAQASWHGKTVLFTANCTITIPAALVDNYIFNGITLVGVTVNWAITTPKTWLLGTPTATAEKQIFTLTQRGATNSILLLGV